MESQALLNVIELTSGYGEKQVLHGASFYVDAGEVVALLGPNGAGKSTALKTIFGLIPPWSGSALFDGVPVRNHHAVQTIRAGMAYVPQGSRVFSEMSVQENLEMGGFALRERRQAGARMERIMSLFPALAARRRQVAGSLSGGERQMLALGRALMTEPRLLLLDEPSLGLAPQMTRETLEFLKRLHTELGVAILLVEQNVQEALSIAHRVYVLRLGKVVLEARPAELNEHELREAFLG